MEFAEQTINVRIDTSKCLDCTTKACVAACKTYSRGILHLVDGKPVVSPEEAKKRGTECLACEYECMFRGKSAITIDIPIKGLAEYRRKRIIE